MATLVDRSGKDSLSRTYRKHLIGLIKDEHLHGVGLQESASDHILDTTRGTDNDLGTFLKSLHVITNAGTTNACMALNVHKVSNSNNNLLDLLCQFTGGSKDQSLALLDVGVELLQDGDGEGGGFSGTRLGLSNNIVAFGALELAKSFERSGNSPLMTGMMARCWIAEGRSKP